MLAIVRPHVADPLYRTALRQDARLVEQNITPWRRAVSGDLTAAFNFASPNNQSVPLPSTADYQPKDQLRHPDFKPVPPSSQSVPKQEPGVRLARAVPYELHATGHADAANGTFAIDFANTGKTAAVFQVRSGNIKTGPWTYTVSPGKSLSDLWTLKADKLKAYDLSVYGPNGFFRAFGGGLTAGSANLTVVPAYDAAKGAITLTITNAGTTAVWIVIGNGYTAESTPEHILPGKSFAKRLVLSHDYGWYDLTVRVPSDPQFLRHVAGHLESGKDSHTDPLISGFGPVSLRR